MRSPWWMGSWSSCRSTGAGRRPICLCECNGLPACRVPARRPGNFHLRPQMKVTKAKRLNAKPLSSFIAPCTPGPAGHLEPPPQTEAAAHSTRPRCALARGPASLRGRGSARPAPPSARQVRCVARVQSGPLGRGSAACRTHERCCVEGLCFGDFHLTPQMKVTRLPGRNPAKPRSRPDGNKKDVPDVDTGPAVTIRIGSLI